MLWMTVWVRMSRPAYGGVGNSRHNTKKWLIVDCELTIYKLLIKFSKGDGRIMSIDDIDKALV